MIHFRRPLLPPSLSLSQIYVFACFRDWLYIVAGPQNGCKSYVPQTYPPIVHDEYMKNLIVLLCILLSSYSGAWMVDHFLHDTLLVIVSDSSQSFSGSPLQSSIPIPIWILSLWRCDLAFSVTPTQYCLSLLPLLQVPIMWQRLGSSGIGRDPSGLKFQNPSPWCLSIPSSFWDILVVHNSGTRVPENSACSPQ